MDDFPEQDMSEEELFYYRQALEGLRNDLANGRIYSDTAKWAKQQAAARKAQGQAQAPKQQPAKTTKPGDYFKQYLTDRDQKKGAK